MKRLMYAEASLLVGDDVADKLVEYAVLLARKGSADSIALHAIDEEGEPVTATMLIGPATIMVAASSTSVLPEPDNATILSYLTEQIGLIRQPPLAHGLDDARDEGFEVI